MHWESKLIVHCSFLMYNNNNNNNNNNNYMELSTTPEIPSCLDTR
jgi:hypothetical protein